MKTFSKYCNINLYTPSLSAINKLNPREFERSGILIWFNFDYQHGKVIASIIKCGVKFFIHSQTLGIDEQFHLMPHLACNYLSLMDQS